MLCPALMIFFSLENFKVFSQIFQARQQRRQPKQRSPTGRKRQGISSFLRAHLQRLRVAPVPPAVAQLPRDLPEERHLRLPRPRPPRRRPGRQPRPRLPLAALVGAARRAGTAGEQVRGRGRQPGALVGLR